MAKLSINLYDFFKSVPVYLGERMGYIPQKNSIYKVTTNGIYSLDHQMERIINIYKEDCNHPLVAEFIEEDEDLVISKLTKFREDCIKLMK